MSMDPNAISQMLMQRLQQSPQDSSFGGGGAGPQMQGRMGGANAAMQLAQKAMLMKALQAQQQKSAQTQFAQGQPAMQNQMQNDPSMQALQQSPQMGAPPQVNPQIPNPQATALQQQALQSTQMPNQVLPTSLVGGPL